MPRNPDKPRCVLCGVNASFRTSAICKSCHDIVRARGQVWCNAGRHAVPRAEWSKAGCCTACLARRSRNRPTRVCAVCAERAASGNSYLCTACRRTLEATGRAWCSFGKHIVPADTLPSYRAPCTACEQQRRVTPGVCGTCGAPLATHARCNGCTRLYHGPLPQPELCHLCARDRAKGVPPQGYSLREVAA